MLQRIDDGIRRSVDETEENIDDASLESGQNGKYSFETGQMLQGEGETVRKLQEDK